MRGRQERIKEDYGIKKNRLRESLLPETKMISNEFLLVLFILVGIIILVRIRTVRFIRVYITWFTGKGVSISFSAVIIPWVIIGGRPVITGNVRTVFSIVTIYPGIRGKHCSE